MMLPRTQSTRSRKSSSFKTTITILYLAIVLVAGGLVLLFLTGQLVIGGVPSSIVITFLQDDLARNAYITGDRQALHDRLDNLGIETQIKAYYRPKIQDEQELDLYIHQILYDRTGYIGEAYQVGSDKKLVLK